MTKISVFQPIGNAASELTALMPGLDHLQAVAVLQEAQEVGFAQNWTGIVTVRFTHDEGWEVTVS